MPIKKPESTTERLELLIDWINAEFPEDITEDREHIDRRVTAFIKSFDGSRAAGYVRAEEIKSPTEFLDERGSMHRPFGVDLDPLDWLHTRLRVVLHGGFRPEKGHPGVYGDEPEAGNPQTLLLQFGIDREARFRPRKREYERLRSQPGIYAMRVAGNRFDLVLFLAMHLLTMPGAIVLERCPAPAPLSAKPKKNQIVELKRCGKFVIQNGGGPPRTFCPGNACRQRNHTRPIEDDRPNTRGRK